MVEDLLVVAVRDFVFFEGCHVGYLVEVNLRLKSGFKLVFSLETIDSKVLITSDNKKAW